METRTLGRRRAAGSRRSRDRGWLFAAVVCSVLISIGVSAAAQVLEWRPTVVGRTRIATTLLHWVEPKATQAGYPESWTTGLRCSVPKVVRVGTAIPCGIYEGPAEAGSLKAKISKLRRSGKGFSFAFRVTGSLKPYRPPTPSTQPLLVPSPTTAPSPPLVTAAPPTTSARVKTTLPPTTVAPPTTPAPPPLPAGSCSGTWSYSGQTVEASVTTPGPATVTVKAVGTAPAFTGNSATVQLGAGQDQANVSFALSETPDSVVAIVAASLITASCTLTG